MTKSIARSAAGNKRRCWHTGTARRSSSRAERWISKAAFATEAMMIDVRRDWAHTAACQIVNLLAGDYPGGKAELYGKIFFLIMNVMFLADEETAARWKEPSLN